MIKEDVIGLESLLSEKKLGVQTDFLQDEQGRLLVIGDREAINRVVYNILTNAIRFTPDEGIIALTTRRSGRPKEIEVIIEDSGPGIPESEYPYIFDRFYKVDKSRTAKGSGLGLYICRTILAAHGQRIIGRAQRSGRRPLHLHAGRRLEVFRKRSLMFIKHSSFIRLECQGCIFSGDMSGLQQDRLISA